MGDGREEMDLLGLLRTMVMAGVETEKENVGKEAPTIVSLP